MNLKVRILHFVNGIQVLGARQSIANAGCAAGGVPAATSIRRVSGGYLVGYGEKFFVIHDVQITAVEVEDADKVPEKAAPEAPSAPVEVKAPLPELPVNVTPKENAKPGDLIVDEFGRYSRVPYPSPAPETLAVVEADTEAKGKRTGKVKPVAEAPKA